MSLKSIASEVDLADVVSGLVGDLGGPTDALAGLRGSVAVSAEAGEAKVEINVSGLGEALGTLDGDLGRLVSALPGAELSGSFAVLELLGSGELERQLRGFQDHVAAQLAQVRDTDFLRALEGIGGSGDVPGLSALLDLLGRAFTAAGVPFSPRVVVPDALPAVVGTGRTLAALMSLETVLAEGERLAGIMALQVDSSRLEPELAAVRGSYAAAAADLARLTEGGAAPGEAEMLAAAETVRAAAGHRAAVEAAVARAMGFGEATLVHWEIGRLEPEVRSATDVLRTVDADAIQRATTALGDRLAPLLRLPLGDPVAATLDELLATLDAQAQQIADPIEALDVTAAAQPLARGVEALLGGLRAVTAPIEQIETRLRQSLESLRAAIAALPVNEVADGVRQVMDPLIQAMETLTRAVDQVKAAVGTAAAAASTALGQIEAALDRFEREASGRVGQAADGLAQLNLPQVIGEVTGNVTAFVGALGEGRMGPYFDTAVELVDGAASVIGAVPFGMLPESMKADVDAALEPVRALDAQQVRIDVEGWVGIEEGGFALRDSLDASLADLREQMAAVMAAVAEADPRRLAPELREQLDAVRNEITGVVPDLTVPALQDGIAALHRAAEQLDPRPQVEAIDARFTAVVAKLDELQPDRLLGPIESQLAGLRTAASETLQLDQLEAALDQLHDAAVGLLGRFDPEKLEALCEQALGDADRLLAELDRVGGSDPFGEMVSALAAGNGLRVDARAIRTVTGWLTGSPVREQLGGRMLRIAELVRGAQASVAAVDLDGWRVGLAQAAGDAARAVQALPAGPARDQLAAALRSLDPAPSLAALSANRSRYAELLAAAAVQTEALARVGLSEPETAATRLAEAYRPLAPIRDFVRRLLGLLGISGLDRGLGQVLRDILHAADPIRVARIFRPIFTAIRGRLTALLDAVVAPLKRAVSQLRSAIELLSVGALSDGIVGILETVKAEIMTLAPGTLLAPTLAALDELRARVIAFDPLAELQALLTALAEQAANVIDRLDPDRLLAEPGRLYDEIVANLRTIQVDALLGPILDELDALAADIDDGLTRTIDAIGRLQAALPSSGGGIASVGVELAIG